MLVRNAWFSLLAVATTAAPASTASWVAMMPTPPAAPATTTVSPRRTRTASTQARAVVPATYRQPAASHGAPCGFGNDAVGRDRDRLGLRAALVGEPDDLVADSDAVDPIADLDDDAGEVAALAGREASPGKRSCIAPWRIAISPGLMPAATTRTRTSPAPGERSSTSATFKTSTAP